VTHVSVGSLHSVHGAVPLLQVPPPHVSSPLQKSPSEQDVPSA
jgi:hypothetical protein